MLAITILLIKTTEIITKGDNKMKNTNINKINQNIEKHNMEDIQYMSLLCKEKSDLVLKTEFGIGRYKFTKFNELQGKLVLEFKLLDDNRFKDTSSIYQNIGNICFLTIQQFISVRSDLGHA